LVGYVPAPTSVRPAITGTPVPPSASVDDDPIGTTVPR
jgi:hypothetical protein